MGILRVPSKAPQSVVTTCGLILSYYQSKASAYVLQLQFTVQYGSKRKIECSCRPQSVSVICFDFDFVIARHVVRYVCHKLCAMIL